MLFIRILKFFFSIFCLKAIANEPPTETGSHIPEIETPQSCRYKWMRYRPIPDLVVEYIPETGGCRATRTKKKCLSIEAYNAALDKYLTHEMEMHEIHLRKQKDLLESQNEISDE